MPLREEIARGILVSPAEKFFAKRAWKDGKSCSIIFASPGRDLQNGEAVEGKVAERSNAPDSKSGVRLYRTVGSNPTLSARMQTPRSRKARGVFSLPRGFSPAFSGRDSFSP